MFDFKTNLYLLNIIITKTDTHVALHSYKLIINNSVKTTSGYVTGQYITIESLMSEQSV